MQTDNVFTRKEYIEREAVREMIVGFPCTMSVCLTVEECKGMRRAKEIILKQMERIPAADVRPVVHGKWHDHYQLAQHCYVAICSCCHSHVRFYDAELPDFCPNCGARMDGDGE